MEPVLSVIIPVYNAEATLARCVESLLIQEPDIPGGMEILLIDDGSRDRSPSICDGYASRHERIRAFHRVNGGVSSARNMGLSYAAGDYIQFVDADDYVDPGYCASLYNTARERDSQLVLTGRLEIWQRGTAAVLCPDRDMAEWRDHRSFFTDIYLNSILNGPHCKLYLRRDIRSGFPEEVSFGEDLLFNLAYLRGISRVASSSIGGYNLVCGGGSLSRRYRENLFRDALALHEAATRFFEESFFQGCDRVRMDGMLIALFRRAAGMLAVEGSVPKEEKVRLLGEWLGEESLGRALAGAGPEGIMAGIFNTLARAGNPALLYTALKAHHLLPVISELLTSPSKILRR